MKFKRGDKVMIPWGCLDVGDKAIPGVIDYYDASSKVYIVLPLSKERFFLGKSYAVPEADLVRLNPR